MSPWEGERVNAHGKDEYIKNVKLLCSRCWLTTKVVPCPGRDLAKEGEHADASVLQFHETKTIKSLLVSIVQQTERVVESKGILNTQLVLESAQGRGGLARGGRGKGGGRSHKGSECGNFHHGWRWVWMSWEKDMSSTGVSCGAVWGRAQVCLATYMPRYLLVCTS